MQTLSFRKPHKPPTTWASVTTTSNSADAVLIYHNWLPKLSITSTSFINNLTLHYLPLNYPKMRLESEAK